MNLRSFCLSLICLVLLSNFCNAGNQPPQTLEELKTAVEKIRKETNTPALGIALVNKHGLYWVAGLGEADVEKHIPANENTMFRVGSVSKMFVALSVLKLVEEGKLHLNDKLHDLAPEIKYENKWEKTNPILLVHLLEHTTGWDEFHLSEISYKATDSTSLKNALESHPDSRRSRWIPGTRYAYTNTGPGVTAYIIEKVTGKKYEDYVQENFFNPLQMSNSSFYKTTFFNEHEAKLYATSKPEDYAYQKYRPSGALNSSAREMANFLQFMISRGEFNGQRLLQTKSIERMEMPESTLGAHEGITAGYGLHNFTTGYEDYGYAFHGHDGGLPGARTALMYSQELGFGYVIMTNNNNGSLWRVTELVTGFLLKDSPKKTNKIIDLSPKLNSIPGIYISINPRNEIMRFIENITKTMKISISDNRVHRSPILGGWESNDYAISENLLVNPWSGLPSIAVVKDPLAGEVLQIESDVYKRIPGIIFYGSVSILLLLGILMLINLLSSLAWLPCAFLNKGFRDAHFKIRIYTLLANISLILMFLLIALYCDDLMMLGTFSWVSATIFVSSLLYLILIIGSLFLFYQYSYKITNKFTYWNAFALSILHTILAIYLAYYGIIGLRGWAE